MCYSFEVSLGTGIASYVLGYILFQRNLTEKEKQYVIAYLIATSMQFVDSILWFSKMKTNLLNYIVTSVLIPIILSIQIIYNICVKNKFQKPHHLILLAGYSFYLFYRLNGYSKPLCNNYFSSPVWGDNELRLWELFIFNILAHYPNWDIIAFFFTIVLLIKYFINGALGSWWCFISALVGVYYYFTLGIKKN